MTRILVALSAILAIQTSVPAQINFTDNFNDGNIDEWTLFDGIGFATGEPFGNLAFPDGGLQIDSPATPDPALGLGVMILGRPDLVFTDFDMSIDLLADESSPGAITVLSARVQAPFTTYLLGTSKSFPDQPGTRAFFMTRLDGIGPTGVAQEELGLTFVDVPDDAILQLRFLGQGSKLTGELFNLSDETTTNPIASITAIDGTYTAGFAEIAAGSGAPAEGAPFFDSFAKPTVDNFSLVATPIPEPSTWSIALMAAMPIIFHRRRPRFRD